MTVALVKTPSIHWTDDDGLYKRVEQLTKGVGDMMLGQLATKKEFSKSIMWISKN